MMWSQVVVVLAVLPLVPWTAAKDLSVVGTCRAVNSLDSSKLLEKLLTENGGTWQYRMVPETEEAKTVSWMTMFMSKGQEQGSYTFTTTYQIKSYKTRPQYVDNVKTTADGQVVSSNADKKPIVFKILKYKENEYAYCYRCVPSDGTAGVDERFVLAHGSLTSEVQQELRAADQQYGFSGNLWYII